ncbi:NUDIX hydrolase [Nakamurella aerolata]|uniref:NUDIX hydrolase n=1 Tax=Nakamurella aerolata TaxID=1656892 RepID=A0A849A1Y3_9ACTN|nr:NUDIX domain-containing protein [Nakamurella aerolata]NNG34629.1 NUDIX hydrolase [Nakamurella aerolata]
MNDATSRAGAGALQAEVLVAVFGVRPVTCTADPDRRSGRGELRLETLLWQRALEPEAGRWSLPGGVLLGTEDVDSSASRQLAEKVDLRRVTHLEQIGVFSEPGRSSGSRTIATAFLAVVPTPAATPGAATDDADLPADTRWHPVEKLPPMAFDHQQIIERAATRLRGKLSYTNIAFALAPEEFTIAELRQIYAAALGHDVDPTNLQRILTRRGMLTATGRTAPPGPTGGRPAALYRFTVTKYRVTDPFAAFRPRD